MTLTFEHFLIHALSIALTHCIRRCKTAAVIFLLKVSCRESPTFERGRALSLSLLAHIATRTCLCFYTCSKLTAIVYGWFHRSGSSPDSAGSAADGKWWRRSHLFFELQWGLRQVHERCCCRFSAFQWWQHHFRWS